MRSDGGCSVCVGQLHMRVVPINYYLLVMYMYVLFMCIICVFDVCVCVCVCVCVSACMRV